ncbi:hypothetical protein SLEP1_g32265 [Rubroshorea leprosula]|uniref:Glutathione S-transferase n=1 Tax=Rubroshorea leprosula TaxID=152421 RepID=A0AAV5KCT9_9ROSI|nr:hypothetical protein SLEP1_g32265 [Rubroshorea leprosula]
MEGKESEVVLIGTWLSPFSKRVELALKLKGIPFEFVEEDIENKSELLLRHNPVHKRCQCCYTKGRPSLTQTIMPIVFSEGKEREKAIEDFQQQLKVFEEGIERDFPGKSPFLNGGNLRLLDLVVGANACHHQAFHDAVAVIIEAAKNPLFF